MGIIMGAAGIWGPREWWKGVLIVLAGVAASVVLAMIVYRTSDPYYVAGAATRAVLNCSLWYLFGRGLRWLFETRRKAKEKPRNHR